MIVPKPFKKHQKEARQGVQPKIRRAKTKTPNQRILLIRIHICLCCRTPASDTTRQGRTKPMNPFRGTPAPSCRTRLDKPETVADMIVPKPFFIDNCTPQRPFSSTITLRSARFHRQLHSAAPVFIDNYTPQRPFSSTISPQPPVFIDN